MTLSVRSNYAVKISTLKPNTGKTGIVSNCQETIIQNKNPEIVLGLKKEPFSGTLKTQFGLWKEYLTQNPLVMELAKALSGVYATVNENNGGFTLKNSKTQEKIILTPKEMKIVFEGGENVIFPISEIEAGNTPVYEQDALTSILLREFRATEYPANSDYLSLVTQANKTPDLLPLEWHELVRQLKEKSSELLKAGLPQTISWVSQAVNAIPPEYADQSAHLTLLKEVGVLSAYGKIHLPNDEQLKVLRPLLGTSLNIGLTGESIKYFSNWHSVASPSKQAKREGTEHNWATSIPSDLTVVNFQGNSGASSNESGSVAPSSVPTFNIETITKPEPTLTFPVNPEIVTAIKTLQGANPAEKTVLTQFIKLFSESVSPRPETLKKLLDHVKENFPTAIYQRIFNAIYTGKGMQKEKLTVNVSHLTDLAERLLKADIPLDQERENFNEVGKLVGRALRQNPRDIKAKVLMAEVHIERANYNLAINLLDQAIESNQFFGKELAELYKLKAICYMYDRSTQQSTNRANAANLLEPNISDKTKKAATIQTEVMKNLKLAVQNDSNLILSLRNEVETLTENMAKNARLRGANKLEKSLYLLALLEPEKLQHYFNLIDFNENRPNNYNYRNQLEYCLKAAFELLDRNNANTSEIKNILNELLIIHREKIKTTKGRILLDVFEREGKNYIELFSGKEKVDLLLNLASCHLRLKEGKKVEHAQNIDNYLKIVLQLNPNIINETETRLNEWEKNTGYKSLTNEIKNDFFDLIVLKRHDKEEQWGLFSKLLSWVKDKSREEEDILTIMMSEFPDILDRFSKENVFSNKNWNPEYTKGRQIQNLIFLLSEKSKKATDEKSKLQIFSHWKNIIDVFKQSPNLLTGRFYQVGEDYYNRLIDYCNKAKEVAVNQDNIKYIDEQIQFFTAEKEKLNIPKT